MKAKLKINLFLIILLLCATSICAQWSATQTFFEVDNKYLNSIVVESDHTIYMGGNTTSDDINNQNFLVAHANLELNTITTFDLTTGNPDNLKSITRLPNGNFAIVGSTFSSDLNAVYIEVSPGGFPIQYRKWGVPGLWESFNDGVLNGNQLICVGGIQTNTGAANGEFHPMIMGIDTETGSAIWAKEYILNGFSGHLDGIIPLNHGFLVVGQIPYVTSAGFDVLFMKIDAQGNRLWSKKVTSAENSDNSYLFDTGVGVKSVHVADGSAITLVTLLKNSGTASIRMSGLLIKTDGEGNMEWINDVGLPLGITAITNLSEGTHPNEIVLTGAYSPVSFDFVGSFIATLTLTENGLSVSDIGYFPSESSSVLLDAKHFTSPNGNGFIAVGNLSGDNDQSESFLVRIDEHLGSWENPNCWIDNVPLQIQQSGGTISSALTVTYLYAPPENSGIISPSNATTSPFLNNDELCLPNPLVTSIDEVGLHEANNLTGFPNPFTDGITLKLGANHMSGQIETYNSHGMRVSEMAVPSGSTSVQLNLGHLPSGVYHIRLINRNGEMYSCKIIKT